jgi:hypothetical protein
MTYAEGYEAGAFDASVERSGPKWAGHSDAWWDGYRQAWADAGKSY